MAPPTVVSSSNNRKRATGGNALGAPTKRARTGILKQESLSLQERFIQLLEEPQYKTNGITNTALKEHFGDEEYMELVPIINTLTSQSRLTMSKTTITTAAGKQKPELVYNVVSEQEAAQYIGLDVSAKMVLQVIERAGNRGIWTKDIRIQTNIQQQALNKIFKALEGRQLIKPVKSVAAKSKKLYMLYHLTPSKELTGGVWYSDLEFDHEFISELRAFLLQCVRRLNQGKGVTLREMKDKMQAAKVSRVELSLDDVQQIVQTLVYDYIIEAIDNPNAANAGDDQAAQDELLYVQSRKVSSNCDFAWWDILTPDFHFRQVVFEDGVTLAPQEPHYHTG